MGEADHQETPRTRVRRDVGPEGVTLALVSAINPGCRDAAGLTVALASIAVMVAVVLVRGTLPARLAVLIGVTMIAALWLLMAMTFGMRKRGGPARLVVGPGRLEIVLSDAGGEASRTAIVRSDIVDVHEHLAAYGMVQVFELWICRARGEPVSLLRGAERAGLEELAAALRTELGLKSRLLAAREWLNDAPMRVEGDDGAVLPYAPAPKEDAAWEREAGRARLFIPPVSFRRALTSPWLRVGALATAVGVAGVTLLSLLTHGYVKWPGVAWATAGSAVVFGGLIAWRTMCRAVVEVDAAGLSLTASSPLGTRRRAWRMDEVRELLAQNDGTLMLRAAEGTPTLLGYFATRAQCRAAADRLRPALGMTVETTPT